MTTRQRLDQAVLQTTGHDIRLVGNWQSVPGLEEFGNALAESLGLPETRLRRCADIADILDLLEGQGSRITPATDEPGWF